MRELELILGISNTTNHWPVFIYIFHFAEKHVITATFIFPPDWKRKREWLHP